jgi:hypothetical protein
LDRRNHRQPRTRDPDVLEKMLSSPSTTWSNAIGALLIYRPDGDPGPPVEERLPTPPPL